MLSRELPIDSYRTLSVVYMLSVLLCCHYKTRKPPRCFYLHTIQTFVEATNLINVSQAACRFCCLKVNFKFFHFLLCSFGKRSAGSLRRGCECIVLEPSEMIVVSPTFQFLACNSQRHYLTFCTKIKSNDEFCFSQLVMI